MKLRAMVLGLALVLTASGTQAHHSAAMFDATRTVTLAGVVTSFQWTNPHSWIRISAAGPGGKPVEWGVEMTSPNLLARAGWRPGTVKPGERVTIVVAPLRDGSPGGQFKRLIFADGRVATYEGIAPAPGRSQP